MRSLIVTLSILAFVLATPGCKSGSGNGNNNQDNQNNNNVAAVCGNDTIEGAENCDGSNLGGRDCSSLNLGGGTLACSPGCSFDVSGCDLQAQCGNDTAEFPEDCDGGDLGASTCESLGFTAGTLSCDGNCSYDTSGCTDLVDCGNGTVDAGEDCDGADLGGQDCQGLGFDAGTLACNATCGFDTSSCSGLSTCGDGAVQNPPEECDGADLGGRSCETFGFDGGTLVCDPVNCTLDQSGCRDFVCGDGFVDGVETCDPPASCPTACNDGNACTIDSLVGDPATCDAACTTAPVTSCVDSDGCCPVACTQATDNDCGPATMPRLLVAGAGMVQFWDNVDTITTSAPPTGALGGPAVGSLALAQWRDRLLVATDSASDPIYIYDSAGLLADGSPNTDTIGVAGFAGNPLFTAYDLKVDAVGHLIVVDGYIRIFADAATVTSTSTSVAQYTHMWGQQIFTGVLDVAGNKLIGGQVSGAGLIAWNDPLGFTGETNDEDFTLHTGAGLNPSASVVAGGRLYVASVNSPNVLIWDNIAAVTATTPPDVELTINLSWGFDLFVRDNVLFVVVNDAPANYKVNVYLNAAGISGDVAPDFEITDGTMTLPQKVWVDQDARMYVVDTDGVLVFEDVSTAPAFVTELPIPNADDLRVTECSPGHPCVSGTCQNGLCL